MLKPYTRQQIQTDKILSSINNTHRRKILRQILTHKDTLYNTVIPNIECITSLESIITNTDSVVIIGDEEDSFMLDKNGGDLLGVSEDEFLGTECFVVWGYTTYIIETNYKNRQDVYTRLPCIRTIRKDRYHKQIRYYLV